MFRSGLRSGGWRPGRASSASAKIPPACEELYGDEDGILFEDEILIRPAGYRIVVELAARRPAVVRERLGRFIELEIYGHEEVSATSLARDV